jgi:hypothetical protein
MITVITIPEMSQKWGWEGMLILEKDFSSEDKAKRIFVRLS